MTQPPRTGVRAPVALLALLAALSTACGAALQTLPRGPGTPAADALALFEEAMRQCRAVTSLSAEMRVSGSAGGQRLRGRVLVGLAAPGAALLDAAAPFGASLFIYAARDGDATLLLPRDRRVLEHGNPAAVLEAVTGVPLGPDDLRHTLTGCVAGSAAAEGRSLGPDWRMVAAGTSDVYLRRVDSGRWRVAAILHPASRTVTSGSGAAGLPAESAAASGWRADYSDFTDDLPGTVRLVSADGRRFNLQLALSQVEVNPRLGAEVFTVKIPESSAPITLDDLRRSGPMADRAQ